MASRVISCRADDALQAAIDNDNTEATTAAKVLRALRAHYAPPDAGPRGTNTPTTHPGPAAA